MTLWERIKYFKHIRQIHKVWNFLTIEGLIENDLSLTIGGDSNYYNSKDKIINMSPYEIELYGQDLEKPTIQILLHEVGHYIDHTADPATYQMKRHASRKLMMNYYKKPQTLDYQEYYRQTPIEKSANIYGDEIYEYIKPLLKDILR